MLAPSPFSLPVSWDHPLARAASRAIVPVVEHATGLRRLARLYGSRASIREGLGFVDQALETLGIEVFASATSLQCVPAEGPLIVVSNHPTGVVDGLAVANAVAKVRCDVKVLANGLLARVPEAGPACIAVDVYAGRGAVIRNAIALRQALRWLEEGHVLVVFPAGRVEHRRAGTGVWVDGPWHPDVVRLIALSGASVVPAFVDATPSRWLRAAGRVHWALRTASLPRELLSHRGRRIQVLFGRATAPGEMTSRGALSSRVAYLRARTYALAPCAPPATLALAEPVAAAADPRALEDELTRLPDGCRVVSNADWEVYVARAEQVPAVLSEIGRLRELAFREVGEGTGRSRDLDDFDARYLHLVAWRRDARVIAGAYRLGCTDQAPRDWRGPELYTRSLFSYGQRLLGLLGPAIELGRAFVHPDYQRDYAPLMLLWRGIGAYVCRHPRYRRLFGPVSLSADLPWVVRQVLVEQLRRASRAGTMAKAVGARRPFGPIDADLLALSPSRDSSVDIEALDGLVRDLDPRGRPMPVLLRQYLKLGGQVLAFSVDPDFGGVVDGLMVVDLASVPAAVLARYMGRAQATAFLDCHRRGPDGPRQGGETCGDSWATATSA